MDRQKLVATAMKARGYLSKKSSKIFVGWQKRFWLIVDSHLCYYLDQTLAQQKGRIQIKKIHKLQAVDKTDLKFLVQGRIYQLRATTTAERDQWLKCLNALQQYEKKNTRRNSPTKKELQTDRKSTLIISPRFMDIQRRSLEETNVINEFAMQDGQDLQQIFKLLGLSRCAEQYQQRRIYERFSYCLCKEGYYFILSSKPVGLSYIDEEILQQTYMQPLKLDTLYKSKIGKQESSEIISCHKILDIKIIDDTCININFGTIIQLKAKNGLELFANRLDKAIQVSKQINNQLNIKLRVNIEPCIKIYDELKSMTQRRQKVKQYFQQKFQKYKNHLKNINTFDFFYKLQEQLIELMVNFVNACKVKIIPRIDLAQQYTEFMHEKIYGLFKEFWNKEHENLKDDQILKLCSMINKHKQIIENYIKDDRVRQGILILINIYFRKMIDKIEFRLENDLKFKNNLLIQLIDKISSTNIVSILKEIISQEIKILYEICNFQEIKHQYNFYIMPIYKIIYNCIQNLIQQEKKDYRLLSALLNDVQSIQKHLLNQINQENIQPSDKKYIYQQIKAMSTLLYQKLIQKLFEILFSDIDTKKLIVVFHEIQMKELVHEILLRIQNIRSVRSHILNLLEIKSLHEIIMFYINCLVKDTSMNIDNIITKINQDRLVLGSQYQKLMNKIQLECEINILLNLIQFLLAESHITIRKHCLTLKNQYADIFTLEMFKSLLILKFPSNNELYNQFLKICVQIFQKKQSSVKSQFLQIPKREIKQETRERRSTLTLNINSPTLAKTKMEGYLQKKKIDYRNTHKIKLFYQERYFRILDGNLLWYLNSNSKQLQNRLNLSEIRKVYKHESKQNVFIIELNDCKYKFKAQNSDRCKKWIDAIIKSIHNKQSTNNAIITKVISKQNQMIKDFFIEVKSAAKHGSYDQKVPVRSLRPSILSTITEKKNNIINNRQTFNYNRSHLSSKMAVQIKDSKREAKHGCWWMFKNCISTQ